MATEFDVEFVPLALAMVAEFGKDATWKSVAGTYTPSTGAVADSSTDYTVKITPPHGVDLKMFPVATFIQGDAQTDIAASGLAFTPKAGDLVTFDSTAWQVVAVQPVYSGELIALFSAQLRR